MTPFRIQAIAAPKPTDPDVTVEIVDDIGLASGSANEFIRAMQASKAKRPIVRIHSRGGDVLDSLAIRSFLASLDTTVEIFGVAASAASYIATAGRKVRIVENGFVMVHAPSGATIGTSSDMRDTADLLAKMETTYVSGYRHKTGKDEATVRGWMAKDTWLTAQEAKDAGLVDEIMPPIAFSASASIRAMPSAPRALFAVAQTAPEAARNAFRKGIQQSDDGLAGDGLEPATVKEARSLAGGERPTEAKVRKANAWWGRNERFLDAEANSPADVAANLWGGAAGRDWFRALFNELEAEQAIVAAAPGDLAVGDYVELSYGDGTTKGEVVEVLTTGTASGADGAVDATAEDPAALVDVLREVGTTGDLEETDVQVARLFSTLSKTDAPRIVEVEDPEAKAKISAPKPGANNQTKPMSKTAKLFALLGVQPAAEDTFLASAIADLGVTPGAVTEARKTGTTDFLATHIADRIAAADNRTNAVLAAVGIDANAPDLTAAVKAKVDELAAKKAAEILASKGIKHDVGNAAAATGAASDKTANEIRAEFEKMKPGQERSAFFAKHKSVLIS